MSTVTIRSTGPAMDPRANDPDVEPLLSSDVLYEVVGNEVRELPPMGARQTQLAFNLARNVGNHAWNTERGLVQTEMLFLIDRARNLQRRPDVSFVSYGRWPKGKPVPEKPAWEVVPELAVEVVSESNGANEIVEKIEDYFACGVLRVWVVYPLFAKVYDYAAPNLVQILTRADRLSGGDILPGFELVLADILEEPTVAP